MLTEIRISLPWPDKALSPNRRVNIFVRARAVRGARMTAKMLTLQAIKWRRPDWQAVALHWEFHPKTANAVDDDNAEASCKAYRDGIADALDIDDSKFTATREIGEPIKGGAVHVTVRPA